MDFCNTAFYFLLNTSITATAIGLLIILLRLIKPLPRNIIYPLWALVLLRLALPFTVSSEFSVFNIADGLIKKVIPVQTMVPFFNHSQITATTTNSLGFAKTYLPTVTFKTQDLTSVFTIASTIWIIVTALLFLFLLVLYILNRRDLRHSVHYKDNLYLSQTLTAPLVSGLFKQKIFLPAALKDDTQALQAILLHENVHIARFDNLKRMLAILVACVHWFNPFVWLFLRSFLNDTELTCDAKAVKKLNQSQRKKYAETLFNFGTGEKMQLSSGFGRSNLHLRVTHVLNYKKLTWLATIVSIFFLVIIFLLLSTNPMQ